MDNEQIEMMNAGRERVRSRCPGLVRKASEGCRKSAIRLMCLESMGGSPPEVTT